MTDKSREQKVRKALYSMGYQLHKSRVKNIHIDDMGLYMVVDCSCNAVVCGSKFDFDLDDIISYFELDI